MSEYIDRESFLAEQRHLYCENCERRKGKMKNGKMRFAYEIGGVPCRACRYGDVLDDLEDYPAADVRPVVLCRDCKCYQQSHYIDNHMECARSGFAVHSVDFCSFGEKREES